jgi:hypothetical protein
VDNQGTLRGAFVVLAAPQVSNSGSIVATGGAAALAAGGRVALDIAGDKLVSLNVDAATANAAVVNSGSISADGGKVFMSAHSANAVLDTVINTSGVVRANSIGMRDGQIVIDGGSAGTVAVSGTLAASGVDAGTRGGAVAVLGDRVSLQAGASVDVSGDAGGGSARIGGDFHGAGALKTASMTQVDKGAAINADAVASGDGGTVAVWSDQHTAFAGSISAKGGAQGGDGGFVETSGKRTLAFSGAVTTKAAKGASGTLLLDPTDITITTSPSSSGSFAGGSFTGSADSSNIQDTDLIAALGASNVIVDATSGGGAGSGNITVGTPIAWNNANSLTLKASHNIDTVGGAITNSGTGAVQLYGDGGITTGVITTTGGAVEVKGTAGGTSAAAWFYGGSITSNGGSVAIVSNGAMNTGAINSGAGTIAVTANNGDVTIGGALVSTSNSATAIVVKAGASSGAGVGSGGDISYSGGSVSVGAGGSAFLYTGTVDGSTGINGVPGGHSRYNSAPGTDNFTASTTDPGTYVIFREQPMLTVAAGSASLTYGDSAPAATASLTGLRNGDTSGQALSAGFSSSYTGVNSGAGLLKAGTYVVTASGAVDQLGYAITYTPGAVTVAQKQLAVSGLTAQTTKVYDGTTSATVSGSPLFATEADGAGSSSDGKAYLSDAVSITGTPSGTYNTKDVSTASSVAFSGMAIGGVNNGNYILATSAPVAATITPKALASSLSAPDKVYDATTTAAPSVTVTAGLVGAETVGINATGSFNSKDVLSANLVTVDGIALADGAGGGLASNYSLAAGGTAVAHITPKLLSTAFTASDKAYDGSTAATSTLAITAGLVGAEAVGVISTASFDSKDVLTASTVTLDGVTLLNGANGGLASNYTLTLGATSSAHITPAALTASVSAPDKVYDATTVAAPAVTLTGGLAAGESLGVSATGSFNSKDVLSANLVTVDTVALANGAGGGLASNYSLAAGDTAVAHITPKALTATITAADKAYDGTTAATPVPTITGGLVGAETVSVASGTGSFNTKDVLTANTVTLNSALLADGANGGIGSNYTITPGATASANITPAVLTASLSAPDKVYDATTTASPVVTVTGGLAAGESLAISATGSFDSKDVLTAGLVTRDSISLADGAGGGLASNYSLVVGSTAVAHITPKVLTATVTAPDKTYDGTTTATPALAITGGLVGAETVNVASSAGSFNSKDVLTAHTVTLDGATLADGANGGIASNYSIAPGATATAHITPAT